MITTETKLNEGDLISVHGWPMLNKLEQRLYRVAKISQMYGKQIYDFALPKGKKIIVRHYANNVDNWIKNENDPDLNKIVIMGHS